MSTRKTVLITGGGTGLGAATARRFAKDGYNVVVNGQTESNLEAMVEELGSEIALSAPGDVADSEAAKSVVKAAVDKFGGLDVLVNNAGVVKPGSADSLSDADFDAMLNVNVRGVRNMCQAALPHLRERKGNIINMSSVSGIGGDWGMYGYNTSKGAVSLMTKGMALDLGPEGIRVNAVAPATANTRLASAMKDNEAAQAAFAARIPMGRIVEPEEVASVIAFLAGPDAAFVTGVILPVDGGLMASNGQPNFGAL